MGRFKQPNDRFCLLEGHKKIRWTAIRTFAMGAGINKLVKHKTRS